MSHLPTNDKDLVALLNNLSQEEVEEEALIILKEYQIQRAILPFFEAYKNPKIFLFYMFLVGIYLQKNNSKIYFEYKEVCYRYDVCERTIKLWLKELTALQLIKYNFKDKEYMFLEILDYKKSLIFTQKTHQKSIHDVQLTQDFQQFPNRFFKDMQSIVNKIVKRNESVIYNIDNALWKLTKSHHKYFHIKDVMIEFQSLDCPNISITINYEALVKESPPPIEHPFHQQIMRSKIKKALQKLTFKGDCNENSKVA
ncbi:hypothetical protein LS71_008435 [Helicobacter jaachi]|uniref:Uncharacterized protein n=1 Tax=Helicobacter jaachi TaxID=1677920 RepID=A0A4V6I2B4_9HELI|nr:hypothetical protein [Helicobacter jaachi]TLD95422.1 hypothetical protein LS71_008435 [Helicobacter jaachi]